MRNYKRSSEMKKTYRGIFVVFIIICIFSILFSFQYYKKLHRTIRDESKNYLQEVSRRIGSNIDRIIKGNFSGLDTIATVLESEEAHSFSEIRPIIEEQASYWGYESMMLVDENGKVYGLDKDEIFLTLDQSMRKSILNKEQSICTAQTINSEEYILISVHLDNVMVDGKNIIALAANYAPAAFDKTLSMTSFNEQAYSQIVTKEGTVVTRPTSKNAINTGYNVFATIAESKLDQGSDLARMKEDIQNDKTGQIGFTLGGVHRYMVYVPLAPEEWYLLTYVPLEVINEKSDLLLNSTIIICCLITVIFVILIGMILLIFYKNKRKLESIAYVDEVTGGHNLKRFYALAGKMLSVHPNTQYALVYTNILNFKVLNDQIGRENGDALLKLFNELVSKSLTEEECIGRISADNFCILLKYDGEERMLDRFGDWYRLSEKVMSERNLIWSMPYTEFGVYVIDNKSLTFHQMIDRGKLALRESTRTIENRIRYGFYDEQARRQLFREKQLEDMMNYALEQGEFKVYLQPKYRLSDGKIGGAEALVRWHSQLEGMIYPDEFISLFEKNGFIVDLDIWVFKEVCKTIRSWKDRGLPVIKVSVNCSRVHFKDPDFMAPYMKIADEYGIEEGEIEIELTENMWLKSEDMLVKVIEKIRVAGFGCSMDDFGSGYSSLNMLQSIPVDTLKIDKIFFLGNCNELDRTEAVVGSIIKMSKALDMVTVAEGVEHIEQVEMLKRTGCDYIQGYVFAKPMPIDEFEKLAFGETK